MEHNVIDMKIMDDVLYNFRRIKTDIYVDRAERVLQNKIRLKNEYEKRQKQNETRLKEYNKRIDKIQNQHDIRNNKRIEANRKRDEQIQKQLQAVKTQERLNHIKRMQHIKCKDIKTQKLLSDSKVLRFREKQSRDIERYQFKHQNTMIPDNQLIFDKCIKNKRLDVSNYVKRGWSYEKNIKNEPQEKIIKEEECYIDSDQSVSIKTCNI